ALARHHAHRAFALEPVVAHEAVIAHARGRSRLAPGGHADVGPLGARQARIAGVVAVARTAGRALDTTAAFGLADHHGAVGRDVRETTRDAQRPDTRAEPTSDHGQVHYGSSILPWHARAANSVGRASTAAPHDEHFPPAHA